MFKKLMIFLVIVMVVVAAIFVVKKKQAQNDAFVPPVVAPIFVKSIQLSQSSDKLQLTLPVQVMVKAEVEQLLTARMTAQVVSLPVREGELVKAGDLLAQLDDKSSRADLSVADAQLAQYKLEQASIQDQVDAARLDVQAQKDTLLRLKKLALIKAASEDQIQQQNVRLAQAEQRLTSAKSQLKAYDELLSARSKQAEAAKNALSYVRLTALQSGVVAERLVQEGDIVVAGTPLLRLVGEGGQRRLLVQLPAHERPPTALLWQDQRLPLVAWPRANAQGLLTYEARVADDRLIPNQSLAFPLVVYSGAGFLLPSQCFIPSNLNEAQVLVDNQGQVMPLSLMLDAVGEGGAVTQDARLQGRRVLCASSDILLRVMAGRAYRVME